MSATCARASLSWVKAAKTTHVHRSACSGCLTRGVLHPKTCLRKRKVCSRSKRLTYERQMSSRFGASPSGPCHHSQSTRGLRRLSPRGSRSTSTSTSVPTTMGRGPRLPLPWCAQTFGCIFAQARTLTRAVTTRSASVGGWASEARIGVEATPGAQTEEDLAPTPLKPLLHLDGIVARVEDEQGDAARFFSEPTEQSLYLFDGDHVGVLHGMDAQCVNRSSPALAHEVELCDELVGPARDDGLPRRVAGWMVVETTLGTALGIAAIPHAHIHGIYGRLASGKRMVNEQPP